ncbi:hypothetical protein V1511DRAFT_507608 [Dipodascopsis uninucleata]
MMSAIRNSNGANEILTTDPREKNSSVKLPLTGVQEHYLKKELISLELERELASMSASDALRRFGAPFKGPEILYKNSKVKDNNSSEKTSSGRKNLFRMMGGSVRSERQVSPSQEISPERSEFPILRHVFVNHVRSFPFLDETKEAEFWQDKVQAFWESFVDKRISTTQDRTEETKRRKLAFKIQKLIEIMMSSAIRTSSGVEKGIASNGEELDVDINSNDIITPVAASEEDIAEERKKFFIDNAIDGHPVNGLDINIVGVRSMEGRKHGRSNTYLEFIIRTSQENGNDTVYVSRKYSEFRDLHQKLLHTFPEKSLPRLPMKNKSSSFVKDNTNVINSCSSSDITFGADDMYDAEDVLSSSMSRVPSELSSSSETSSASPGPSPTTQSSPNRAFKKLSLKRSQRTLKSTGSIVEESHNETHGPTRKLPGELQRLSLRAFLRSLLAINTVAENEIFRHFLTERSFKFGELTPMELFDIQLRKEADSIRLEEQFKFYQIATQRAQELDHYITLFKKDIVQKDGLSRFFSEIREKDNIKDLSPQYQKFVEWARIEVAATIYHLFVAQDNASELLAQTRRIHRLMPYGLLKNVIRFSNPVSMMKAVLDLFLAQPFGQKSLLQRILYIALSDDVKVQERAIHILRKKIGNDGLCDRIQQYVDADVDARCQVDWEADEDGLDIIVAISKTDELSPPLDTEIIGKVINSWVAWNIAVEDVNTEIDDLVRHFSDLKTLLKLMIRKRDKDMVLSLSGERVTVELLKDLFTIFYQPLVKVYKSANVYNSVGDIAAFVDDLIKTVDECEDGLTSDANVLVQKFVDLCERHQESFYRFVHEVHVHDNGLFTKLMLWIENILRFLREGPNSTIDMNALFLDSISSELNGKIRVNHKELLNEIDAMIQWNIDRKAWREQRLRDRLRKGKSTVTDEADSENDEAIDEAEWNATIPKLLRGEDFGLHGDDLEDYAIDQSDLSSEDDEDVEGLDPIEYERRARARRNRRGYRSGEPQKPELVEIPKLVDSFMKRLRLILA